MSSFVLRIVLLALPGIVASRLYRKLRGRSNRPDWESFLEILVFSLASYGIVHMVGFDRAVAEKPVVELRATLPVVVQSADVVEVQGPTSFTLAATQPTVVSAAAGWTTAAATQPVTIIDD